MKQQMKIFSVLLLALTTMPVFAAGFVERAASMKNIDENGEIEDWILDNFCSSTSDLDITCGRNAVAMCNSYKDNFMSDKESMEYGAFVYLNSILRKACDDSSESMLRNFDGIRVGFIQGIGTGNLLGVNCKTGYEHPKNGDTYAEYKCTKKENSSSATTSNKSGASKAAVVKPQATTPSAKPAASDARRAANEEYAEKLRNLDNWQEYEAHEAELPPSTDTAAVASTENRTTTNNDDGSTTTVTKFDDGASFRITEKDGKGVAMNYTAAPNRDEDAKETTFYSDKTTGDVSTSTTIVVNDDQNKLAPIETETEFVKPADVNASDIEIKGPTNTVSKKDIEKSQKELQKEFAREEKAAQKEQQKADNEKAEYEKAKNALIHDLTAYFSSSEPLSYGEHKISVKTTIVDAHKDIQDLLTEWKTKCNQTKPDTATNNIISFVAEEKTNLTGSSIDLNCKIKECSTGYTTSFDKKTCVKSAETKKQEKNQQNNDNKTKCAGKNGRWDGMTCWCGAKKQSLDDGAASCPQKEENVSQQQNNCKAEGGEWKSAKGTCDCKDTRVWNKETETCELPAATTPSEKEQLCKNNGGIKYDAKKDVCTCPDKQVWQDNECKDATAVETDKNAEKLFLADTSKLEKAFDEVVKAKTKECTDKKGTIKDGICEVQQ